MRLIARNHSCEYCYISKLSVIIVLCGDFCIFTTKDNPWNLTVKNAHFRVNQFFLKAKFISLREREHTLHARAVTYCFTEMFESISCYFSFHWFEHSRMLTSIISSEIINQHIPESDHLFWSKDQGIAQPW